MPFVDFQFPSYYVCLLQQTIRAVSRDVMCQMDLIHNTALHTSLGVGYNPGKNQSCGMLQLKENNPSCSVKVVLTLRGQRFWHIQEFANIFLPSSPPPYFFFEQDCEHENKTT